MNYTIRQAKSEDVSAIKPLFPRLASFELPPQRVPNDLWQADLELLEDWSRDETGKVFVLVAVDESNRVLGASVTSLRAELLSHAPSAHLEVLVVAEGAEGQGIGKTLIDATEQAAKSKGAGSMTLHVFATNTRARSLYQRSGYDEELLRCIKHFEI